MDTLDVLLPYGFTLFSNGAHDLLGVGAVLLPYGFTLFSNYKFGIVGGQAVLLPYGFTLFSNPAGGVDRALGFYYLMDLHYSQT